MSNPCLFSNSQKPVLKPYSPIVRSIDLIAVESVRFVLEYVCAWEKLGLDLGHIKLK